MTRLNCKLCKRVANVFTVIVEGEEVQACSRCITSKHLTGWSK